MLKKLLVKDFAIIEDIEVEFFEGMTVLTGQTGAGKSLIIDSINLLLGSRASKDMIRYGKESSYIEATLIAINSKAVDFLNEYEVPYENELTISRTISNKNTSKILLNNKSVTLAILKELGFLIGDVHIQHDTFRLINKENYLSFVDDFSNERFKNTFDLYVTSLYKYKSAVKEYKDIILKKDKSLEKVEFLNSIYAELSSLDLREDEDITLESEINKLSNFDLIYTSLEQTYNYLSLSDNLYLDNIYQASANLDKIAFTDKKYEEYSERLKDFYYVCQDIISSIKDDIENMDFNPDELDALEQRSETLKQVSVKYHRSINDIIKYLSEIKLELDLTSDFDKVLKDKENKVRQSYNDLLSKSKNLSEYRQKLAKDIEKSIVSQLGDLELPNAKFVISFSNKLSKDIFDVSQFFDNGVDDVDFLISLNQGEPPKPLANTSSGGEMSRIMLAFKSYFSSKQNLEFMVFDEIDTGISGTTSIEVAQKMKDISEHMQVLCITHLPQVAAKGDKHYYIYKEVIDNRTITKIKPLSFDDRILEIAKMLSGKKLTNFAIEHATNLLKEEN